MFFGLLAKTVEVPAFSGIPLPLIFISPSFVALTEGKPPVTTCGPPPWHGPRHPGRPATLRRLARRALAAVKIRFGALVPDGMALERSWLASVWGGTTGGGWGAARVAAWAEAATALGGTTTRVVCALTEGDPRRRFGCPPTDTNRSVVTARMGRRTDDRREFAMRRWHLKSLSSDWRRRGGLRVPSDCVGRPERPTTRRSSTPSGVGRSAVLALWPIRVFRISSPT